MAFGTPTSVAPVSSAPKPISAAGGGAPNFAQFMSPQGLGPYYGGGPSAIDPSYMMALLGTVNTPGGQWRGMNGPGIGMPNTGMGMNFPNFGNIIQPAVEPKPAPFNPPPVGPPGYKPPPVKQPTTQPIAPKGPTTQILNLSQPQQKALTTILNGPGGYGYQEGEPPMRRALWSQYKG